MSFRKQNETRIHSSRMRTVRCSGRRGEGWCLSAKGDVCLGGLYTSPSYGQTDTCENITFQQIKKIIMTLGNSSRQQMTCYGHVDLDLLKLKFVQYLDKTAQK